MSALSRRAFLQLGGKAVACLLPTPLAALTTFSAMSQQPAFDVIIIGGSYSGLAAAMALGRARRKVLVIDSGDPCNKQTPHSHNFLTQDGVPPGKIAAIARQQVEQYPSVQFLRDEAVSGHPTVSGFKIRVAAGAVFQAKKLVFATGITDIHPPINGLDACWGISVLHCPYCHGYEVSDRPTGILANGDEAFEFARLISSWTGDLTVYTNGPSTLTEPQVTALGRHHIRIKEQEIDRLDHTAGQLRAIVFRDGTTATLEALYTRAAFRQHCPIPEGLGCQLTEEGYIQVDPFGETSVQGIFASGDNTSRMRTVAHAVAAGTMAGIAVNKQLIVDTF